jgi:hypothetical protein
MTLATQHTLALAFWFVLVALKLLGLARRWRLRGGQLLGGAFQRELRRRGLVAPAP